MRPTRGVSRRTGEPPIPSARPCSEPSELGKRQLRTRARCFASCPWGLPSRVRSRHLDSRSSVVNVCGMCAAGLLHIGTVADPATDMNDHVERCRRQDRQVTIPDVKPLAWCGPDLWLNNSSHCFLVLARRLLTRSRLRTVIPGCVPSHQFLSSPQLSLRRSPVRSQSPLSRTALAKSLLAVTPNLVNFE